MRLTAPVGLLLACLLLAGLPTAASASTAEVRGEWALTLESPEGTIHAIALITEEANAKGEFAAHSMAFESVIAGTFVGTLEGATATVETTSQEFGPVPAGKFRSETMKVEEGVGTLALSGEGELKLGAKEHLPAKLTATRIKSGQQIEEQEELEKKEHEESEARANIRGEWAVTIEGGGQTLKGTALITENASAQNIFASKSALFEGFIGGTFGGKLKYGEAEITITTDEIPGTIPPGSFTSNTIAVSSKSNPASMSGAGISKFGQAEFPSMLTATKVKTYSEVLKREKAEQEAKEKQEKEAQEAVEKVAREKQEQEQKAKELKESQERAAREAAEKAAAIQKAQITPITPVNPALMSALLSGKTLTVSSSGAISLDLTNPNSSSVHGHLKVTLAKAGKASSIKSTTAGGKSTLGEVSFSISGKGTEVVKLKLSRSWRTQLAHSKTLHVLVTLTTQATGQPGLSKVYSLTLRAPSSAHHGKG
jgi:hypothetical protein